MTGNDETTSVKAIEMVRRLNHKLAQQCHARGITVEDVAMASLFTTFDIAQSFSGDQGAVEWLRTGADLIERQLMEGTRQ